MSAIPYFMKAHRTVLVNIHLLYLLPFLLFILPNHLVGAPTGLFFSAPYSGEKVAGYEVTLPVTRNDKKSFIIPDNCHAVLEAYKNGADRWGNRVERSIWRKVQLDCDYVIFLDNFPRPPSHDFVSGYDFMNIDLQDIPFWSSCGDTTADDRHANACNEIFNQSISGFSSFFGWNNSDTHPPVETSENCRINNGIFRGRVVYDQTGIHCVQDRNEPGFRIIAVDYADVNGDDFLDAILRLIPLGRGVSRTPLILPLTRKEPDGVFAIPQNLPRPLPDR